VKWFEEWKQLALSPTKTIPTLAGKIPVSQTLFKLLVVTAVTSVVLAFGESGRALKSILRLGDAEFFIAAFAYFVATMAVGYGLMHLVAKALGGKGRISDLAGFWAIYVFPLIAFQLASLIPYVGGLFLAINGLAGLYAIWIQFKVLRLAYGLSRNRTIATYAIHITIMAIISTAVVIIMMFPAMFSGGVGSGLRDTGAGYHYYSPLHGGYSYDYPYGWKSSLGEMPANGTAGLLAGLMQNEFFSMDLLVEKSANRSIGIVFYPTGAGGKLACDKSIAEQGSGRVDTSDAEVFEVSWGGMEGCLIENVKNRGSKASSTLYITNACGENSGSLLMVMMTPGSDYQPAKNLVETLKCGKDAVK